MEGVVHYAHTNPLSSDPMDWELLFDHLQLVAEGDGEVLAGAAGFANAFGARRVGALLGWLHDLGKYSVKFQSYLLARGGSDRVGEVHRAEITGRVDHSTAGAQHIAKLGVMGRLLAYCIAGHHAGLRGQYASRRCT